MSKQLPNSITLIRHGESEHNILTAKKEAEPVYQKFMRSYERSTTSRRTRDLAEKVLEHFARKWGEPDIPLTQEGVRQAVVTGQKLGLIMPPPDIIFCSPYLRTRDTLAHIAEGWPRNATVATAENLIADGALGHRDVKHSSEIENVEVIFSPLLCEQQYGLGILHNDWRVFQALNPEQKRLRDLNNPYWYRYPQGESIPDVQARDDLFWAKYEDECAGKDVLIVSHHRYILSCRANKENFSPEKYLQVDKTEKPTNCGITIYKNVAGKLELECYNKCLWKD